MVMTYVNVQAWHSLLCPWRNFIHQIESGSHGLAVALRVQGFCKALRLAKYMITRCQAVS